MKKKYRFQNVGESAKYFGFEEFMKKNHPQIHAKYWGKKKQHDAMTEIATKNQIKNRGGKWGIS